MSEDRHEPRDRQNEIDSEDPLGSIDELASQKVPDGVDRRAFLMRSARSARRQSFWTVPCRPNSARTGWRQRHRRYRNFHLPCLW